ncbi:uncharacterized protein LOC142976515 [Anticarsia gemmatalis]|uniref:uncharacterized protein LOC142976515 n=1 Tax=Anticarsia gemmatalis TaxID=129554 RepID=UPI003F760C1A
MNSIYIVGIIILMGKTDCIIEDTTSIKISEEQRILLRKLQNFEQPKVETKPLTWNEMLADVLVNRIKIFSFNKVDESDIVKEYSVPSKTRTMLTNCFSQVLLLYKNCIYDKFATTYEEPGVNIPDTTTEVNIVVRSSGGGAEDGGPKSEIEIIEPRYHGKVIDSVSSESEDCPEGAMRDEKGNCVKEISRLLISVPGQCPAGYRADRLGNCRMVFF